MSKNFIDYSQMIDDAMHVIVINALKYVKQNGLPGKHHFFISFSTLHPDVSISETLKEKYPEEMTIVLQHQFEELHIDDKFFSVVLSFNNKREKLVVPFSSLVAFADPSVKFGLQFRSSFSDLKDIPVSKMATKLEFEKNEDETDSDEDIIFHQKDSSSESSVKNENNVVSLDKFRKK